MRKQYCGPRLHPPLSGPRDYFSPRPLRNALTARQRRGPNFNAVFCENGASILFLWVGQMLHRHFFTRLKRQSLQIGYQVTYVSPHMKPYRRGSGERCSGVQAQQANALNHCRTRPRSQHRSPEHSHGAALLPQSRITGAPLLKGAGISASANIVNIPLLLGIATGTSAAS